MRSNNHLRWSAGSAVAVAIALLLAADATVGARADAPPRQAGHAQPAAQAPASQDHGATGETAGKTQEHAAGQAHGDEEHGESIWMTLARLFNFAVLAGVLLYYLRPPIAGYLSRRSTEIRGDLTRAAETSQAATRDLERIEEKMRSLPGEIEALKTRGAAEIAAEDARIRSAAAAERERLVEQARREIDAHLRAAERDLRRQAADLAVGLAGERIKQAITDKDEARLVDRYLAQVRNSR